MFSQTTVVTFDGGISFPKPILLNVPTSRRPILSTVFERLTFWDDLLEMSEASIESSPNGGDAWCDRFVNTQHTGQ